MLTRIWLSCAAIAVANSAAAVATTSSAFMNFENAPVHPIDLRTADATLAISNLPAARVELFSVSTGTPEPLPGGIIGVGVDPTTVRFRPGTSELWVTNKISDTVSVIDTVTRRVVATIATGDEPCDVVFAGSPQRAFVTCTHDDVVEVFDPGTRQLTNSIAIRGQRPRAMAVSSDGMTVYAAIFESGNRTTLLAGGLGSGAFALQFPPNAVSDAAGPYAGQNPPPNNGNAFTPPIAGGNTPLPGASLIVRKRPDGTWRDDNNGDWTSLVSGANASRSGRITGWDVIDNDVAIIDANSLNVSYRTDLLNIGMAIAASPTTNAAVLVGTDARNEVRFEPNLNGRFVDTIGAAVGTDTTASLVENLNGANFGSTTPLPLPQRQRSLGDPRAVAFAPDGQTVYVAGMGSNNVVRFDTNLQRIGDGSPVLTGAGPCGIAVDAAAGRLYVFNRFDSSISVVDAAAWAELSRTDVDDPTPQPIKAGRRFLYDTVAFSGTGHLSCGSCHVDGRMDRLSWDLGDPTGAPVALSSLNYNLAMNLPFFNTGFQPFHPMKGPMVTQTLQDIVGHEPFHWRGDRLGLEDFNGTFIHLMANDRVLSATEMQQFENFLASVTMPPNPYRNIDNTLKWSLPLKGHVSTGRFSAVGTQMPPGNAQNGLALYVDGIRKLDANAFSCATCHTIPTGAGSDHTFNGTAFVPIPRGPRGESHQALFSIDGSQNVSMKVPQLRNMADKVGTEYTTTTSYAGFGFVHDGSIDSLVRFLSDTRFLFQSDQEMSDMIAFMLSMSGSDLPNGAPNNPNNPPGAPSVDAPAGAGKQLTLDTLPAPSLLTTMTQLAQSPTGRLDLIAKAVINNEFRGWFYDRATGRYLGDRDGESLTPTELTSYATSSPVTFTLVPRGTGRRQGIDDDLDGYGNRTEKDSGSDGKLPSDVPKRATLAFSGASDLLPGVTTVTLGTKGDTSNLLPLSDVADTVWHIESNRPGWTTATLTLTWTPTDVQAFTVGDIASMRIFHASSPSGPWAPLPTVVNTTAKTASVELTGFSWFALAKGTVPVKISSLQID